jgi:hypothetical protein
MSISSNTHTLLGERVERLDELPVTAGATGMPQEIVRFVEVMASITHTQLTASPYLSPSQVVDPKEADDLVASCRLVDAIAELDRTLVNGPLAADRQEWTAGTSQSTKDTAERRAPSRTAFVAPDPQLEIPVSTKPFSLGLYTSTALPQAPSMWRAYLDEYGGGSRLFPRPWYSWRLRPYDAPARVCEITSASEWAGFINSYPVLGGGKVYPDWRAAAQEFDAVHVTARAVVAIQGFQFPSAIGLTAPAYWDIESTFWLKWSFADATLVDTVRD